MFSRRPDSNQNADLDNFQVSYQNNSPAHVSAGCVLYSIAAFASEVSS